METVNVSMRLLCKMGYSVKEVLVMLLIISCGRIAYSQGTVSFSNAGPGVNAPVYESDGVTKVSGPLFMAELLAGALADNISPVASTAFGTGNSAGYFFAGTQTVSGVLPGTTAWVQVDVWNTASGASFSQAQSSGLPNSWWQSSVFSVETGGVPTGTGPTPPAALTGLGLSPLFLNVPEPSTFALTGLGVALVLFGIGRRKVKGGH